VAASFLSHATHTESELRLGERNNPDVANSIILVAHDAREHGNIIKLLRGCAAKTTPLQARESDDDKRFRTASERLRAQHNALYPACMPSSSAMR